MEFYGKRLAGRLDKWLGFAVDNKVQQINLCLEVDKSEGNGIYYKLPKTLVINAKYLTNLELSQLELNSRYSFDFPSLKLLSLGYVRFSDNDVLDKVLLGSPSLENLKLYYLQLNHPDHIHIHSSSLKFLQIKCYVWSIPVQIEAINLESLELRGVFLEKTNLSICKALRNLELSLVQGTKESLLLEYHISNLHQLESLTLCDPMLLGLKHFKISNHHLKCLKLTCSSIYETRVIIEAPKLVSVYYEGSINHSISIESSNLLNGKFTLLNQLKKYDGDWFIDMMNFLVNLNCSWNMVRLDINSEKALIFPEKMKKICCSPSVNFEHLTVFTYSEVERESDLRNALLWISPSLKSLTIIERESTYTVQHFKQWLNVQ